MPKFDRKFDRKFFFLEPYFEFGGPGLGGAGLRWAGLPWAGLLGLGLGLGLEGLGFRVSPKRFRRKFSVV